ncbi:hypothetical protein MMC14_001332, partial [Varicellaria rhodocarpa]|nr:hypothetical protein [Varicellaria rhodocarpa]
LAFAFAINYSILISAIKVSTLILYRRIFIVAPKHFKIGWWFNLVYLFSYNIAILGGLLSICQPISALWKLSPQANACPHETEVADISFAVLNGLGDMFILSLPIPVVWNLQMPPRKKFAVFGIFLLGSL